MKKESVWKAVSVLLFLIVISISIIYFVSASEKYTLSVTNEHPFLINGEWVSASSLRVGDLLTTVDGKKARITKITDVVLDSPVNVYNLEAGTFNDFVVDGGVVVHNSNLNRINYVGRSDPLELPKIGEMAENSYSNGREGISHIQAEGLAAIAASTKDSIIHSTGNAINFAIYDSCGKPISTVSYFNSPLGELGGTIEIGRIATRYDPTTGKLYQMKPREFFLVIDSMIKDIEAKGIKKAVCVANLRDARAYRTIFKARNANNLLRDNPQFMKDNGIVLKKRSELTAEELAEIDANKLKDEELLYKEFVKNGKTYRLQYQVSEFESQTVRKILDCRLQQYK